MIHAFFIALLALVCAVTGCRSFSQNSTFHDFRLPTLREQCGVATNAQPSVRVGYLADMAMQHPSISDRDDYLDLYDEKGNWRNQIVIVFEQGVPPPADRTRPVEIKGPVGRIDMGGPPGTKGEYANDVFFFFSWRYLQSKDVPRKKTVAQKKPDSTSDHALLRFDWGAKAALKSIGVDREPVSVKHIPAGIDVLRVELPSYNTRVPNLTIGFTKMDGQNWSLSTPQKTKLEDWLKESSRQ